MHLLQVTFTLPIGRHPSRIVVLILLLCSRSRFLVG
jgi:hypothetical protein